MRTNYSTECRGVVVTTHVSYSESPGSNFGLKSDYRPTGWAFRGFLWLLQANAVVVPQRHVSCGGEKAK
jgi:hypothetical protein